jgi:hypothetical protein
MISKILAGSVLGLVLVGACAQEQKPTRPSFATQTPGGPSTPSVPPVQSTAGNAGVLRPGDFGSNPDGLMTIAGGPSGSAGDGTPKEELCGEAHINTGRVTPKVWLVLDGSGSMAEPLSSSSQTPSRWDALREALMDPNGGVVPTLERLVKFGMVLYDGPLGGFPGTGAMLPDGGPATGMPPTDECPRLSLVEPDLMNFMKLDAAIPTLPPGGSTPTHKALAQVLSHLPATTAVPDGMVDPTYVVLATDGAPNDFCTMGGDPFAGIFGGMGGMGGNQVTAEVISTTTKMAQQGVPVYVVSLAAMDANLMAHLNQVAQAGGTMKAPFTPQNKDELVQTFRDIIGPDVFCEVKVKGFGIMPAVACQGTVMLNGQKLECGDDGWRLKDPQTIEVTGSACEKFKNENNALLTASFPCELQIPG